MDTLDSAEIRQAQEAIDAMSPGVYILKEILGDEWEMIHDPTQYGKRFSKSVEKELLTRIRGKDRNTANHQRYRIK